VGLGYTDALAGAVPPAGWRGVGSVKLVRRLARMLGDLLLTDPTPPGHGARFELHLPLTGRTSREPLLANAALSR
jgi:hypothetical protein